MAVYIYKHPESGEEFEEIRSMSSADEPFFAPDGVECERVLFPSSFAVINKNAEVWEKDPSYVKSLKPKYVRTRSGHKIRYDPQKHS